MTKKLEDSKVASAKLMTVITNALSGYQKGKDGLQKACIAVLVHAFNYKDYSACMALISGVSDGNGKSMRLWFEKFGGIEFDLEQGKTCGWKGTPHIEASMEEARAKPWYTMTPPNAFTGGDFEKDAMALLSKYNKLKAKIAAGKLSEEDKSKVNLQITDGTLRALLAMAKFDVIDGDAVGERKLVPMVAQAA